MMIAITVPINAGVIPGASNDSICARLSEKALYAIVRLFIARSNVCDHAFPLRMAYAANRPITPTEICIIPRIVPKG